jgi:hypothetical protein
MVILKILYRKFFSRKDVACYIHFFCFWVPLPFSVFRYIMNRGWFLFFIYTKILYVISGSLAATPTENSSGLKFKYPVKSLES